MTSENPDEECSGDNRVDAEADVASALAMYESGAEWIRFADAKAGAVLAANGVFASFLIPTLKDVQMARPSLWVAVSYLLFVLWAASAIASGSYALRCIMPFRPLGRHPAVGLAPHFHSAATAAAFAHTQAQTFLHSYQALTSADLQREVLTALFVDAYISDRKYRLVKNAVGSLGAVTVAGFGYLLALQWVG